MPTKGGCMNIKNNTDYNLIQCTLEIRLTQGYIFITTIKKQLNQLINPLKLRIMKKFFNMLLTKLEELSKAASYACHR